MKKKKIGWLKDRFLAGRSNKSVADDDEGYVCPSHSLEFALYSFRQS